MVHDVMVEAVVDTGAQATVLSEDFIKGMDLTTWTDPSLVLIL